MKIYKKMSSKKPYSFLVSNTNLLSDNFLRFRCNLLKKDIKSNHDNQ